MSSYVPTSSLSPPPSPFDFGHACHTFPDIPRHLHSRIVQPNHKSIIPEYRAGWCPRWVVPDVIGLGEDIVDYAVRDDDGRGPVIRQRLWQPRYESSRQELVFNAPLCDPIYFPQENSDEIGIPILEAQAKRYHGLSHWYEPLPLGGKTTAQVRILYGNYPEYRRQLQIKDETSQRNSLTRGKFVQHLANSIVRFLCDNAHHPYNPPLGEHGWLPIGPGGIMPENVILIGAVQVSAGSWTPILRLSRPLFVNA